jgi:hypothetical protein
MKLKMRAAMLLLAATAATPALADPADFAAPGVPSLRDRATAQDVILKARLDTLIPRLMRQHKVDMWILIAREYNEDPVVKTMLPANWMSARRRTVLIFHDAGPEKGVERLSVARYPVGDIFAAAWDPEKQPDQWARIAEIVRERNPARIAINISDSFALADGLTVSQHRQLSTALGPLAERLVSHDSLALGWLETRIPAEMGMYRTIMRSAHAMIAQGLSEKVITPSVTTTADVLWWYRERLADLRLDPWCQPSVSIQRPAQETFAIATQTVPVAQVIQPGDLLHVDFCAGYLGLKTDTQQMAYVLKPGETTAPKGLAAGFADANRVQDILIANFKTGLTGNALLAIARKQAIAAGLKPVIYTHAIGNHGHGAGPWIGAWEDQNGVPGMGEYPIHADTAWSIELAAMKAVPEWNGQEARFMLEVDGFFDGKRFEWIDGRQTELHLIPRQTQ